MEACSQKTKQSLLSKFSLQAEGRYHLQCLILYNVFNVL